MKIWIDADACPRAVKDVLFRAAERRQVPVVCVANGNLNLPRSPLLSSVRVGAGLDVADAYIAAHAQSGDVAITADVPLAAQLVPNGVTVLDPRGELYDAESVKERLAMRDLMKDLRDTGVVTGGPKAWSARDTQAFANALDRLLGSVR